MKTAAIRKAGWTIAALAVAGCGGEHRGGKGPASAASNNGEKRPATCPAIQPAPERLPGVLAEHRQLSYWLERAEAAGLDVDETLLSVDEIDSLNASFGVPREGFYPQVDLLAIEDPEQIYEKVAERRAWLNDKRASGEYIQANGSRFETPLAAPPARPEIQPEIRIALGEVPFFCAPTEARFLSPEADPRIDHNRCSAAGAQEPILVYASWPKNWLLARTRYTWGYIRQDAPLSPPLSETEAAMFVRGPFATIAGEPLAPAKGAPPLAAGTRVPLDGDGRIAFATTGGVATAPVPADRIRANDRPLTRRAVLTEAFRFLGTPYGYGGAGGGRDCSRLLLDLFESFGIAFPRHSTWQARAGSYRIDVTEMDEASRLRIIDAAHRRGVVLLHFPGHIMLYLGRDHRDEPMALHAFSEYLAPCAGGEGETMFTLDEVTVSNLELGRGSSRGAFIERLTDVVVLGKPPGPKLAGIAQLRPAAPASKPGRKACRRAGDRRLFVSPEKPSARHPLRVIATRPSHPGSMTISLFGPDGQVTPEPVTVGGPPYGYVATVEKPAPGKWTAVVGDGEHLAGCITFRVSRKPDAIDTGSADGPAWTIRREWSPAMEELYAVFVERLFDYPPLEDLTWPNLHTLMRDPARNILFNHLGQNEDPELELVPDCADLPYTLRAYFAWKLGLPFGFRECSRAREGQPPRCQEGGNNLMSRSELPAEGDVRAFEQFIHRGVRRAVHSSSGRTHPADDDTDFYPVPLTREALAPGTLFVDPYGHLMVVADWVAQGTDGYGMLIAADAQPDGTVGRRRFWRGSFMFIPDAKSGGAGFKAFRPWRVADDGSLFQLKNKALKDRARTPYSTVQYDGSTDAFYDRMNALINPRPLDPLAAQEVIIDALEEAVVRRIVSVDNGEKYMRETRYGVVEMPPGASIFRTTGPWEDFATPSRDWRLLVSIYVTLQFPDRVLRSPEQFGVPPEEAKEVAAKLREALEAELASRTFSYTRSDGSTWELSLKDVVDRRVDFEMAYNPNDCVEIRWAAPKGSEERKTCKRHAPAEQIEQMQKSRPWFAERRRPPT